MNVQSVVEVSALVLAVGAAVLSVRPAPSLDWEQLWKLILATVIRGDVEAGGGDQSIWWDRLSVVPYHPVGRDAGSKLVTASIDEVAVPALEGERALVERLAALQTPAERWESMYRSDAHAQESLMQNPMDLGAAYDPSAALAPGMSWDSVAHWSAPVQAAIARRLGDVVVAVIGRDVTPMMEAVPHASVVAVQDASPDGLLGLLSQPHQRLVLVVEGDAAFELIQVLHGAPSLRDRVLMVLSLGGRFGGEDRSCWMDAHFQHLQFDTELNRRTLYAAMSDMDSGDIPQAIQHFTAPPVPPSGWAPIEAVDLGPIPLSRQDPALFSRALWVFLCFCLSSR
jgi:hypothetical protein